MAGELKRFRYDLVIWAENAQQADRVMVERVGFDEDLREYGVGEYKIDADPVDGRVADPLEVAEPGSGAGTETSTSPS